MLKKEERTMEVYKDLGARLRLVKQMICELQVDARKVLDANECLPLTSAAGHISKVCHKADNRMFKDHNEISDDHTSVFYGAIKRTPINEVDEEIIDLAKKRYDSYFK